MNQHAIHAEFERHLDVVLNGLGVADRLTKLRAMHVAWEREGSVPVNGKIVSLGPQYREVSYDLPVIERNGTSANTLSHGRKLLGAGLMVIMALLLGLLFSGIGDAAIAGPRVPSQPVTAADGATAPVSLGFANKTLVVRAFDPAAGWPDVTAAEVKGAALWGKTTINITLGVDASELEAELDALTPGTEIRVQQAQGTIVRYQVVEQIEASTTDINYAAQNQVALTIVGMSANSKRRIIRALPETIPVPVTEMEHSRFEVHSPVWEQTPGKPLILSFALDITVPSGGETIPKPWNLDVQFPDGSHQTVPIVPTEESSKQTVALRISDVQQDTVELTLILPGNVRGTVAFAVPPRPTAAVRFDSAQRTNDQISVKLFILPDGPVQLIDTAFACRSSAGIIPLILDNLVFPAVITVQKEVIGRCSLPATFHGQVEVIALEDRAIVSLP